MSSPPHCKGMSAIFLRSQTVFQDIKIKKVPIFWKLIFFQKKPIKTHLKLILLPETLYFEVQKTVCLGKLHKNFYSAFSQSLHLSLKNSENMTTSRKSSFRCLHLLPKIEKLFKCKCLSLFLVFVYFFVDFECPGESFSDLKR